MHKSGEKRSPLFLCPDRISLFAHFEHLCSPPKYHVSKRAKTVKTNKIS